MTCRGCDRDGPDGRFCAHCGRDQTSARGRGAATERYVAQPGEATLVPSIVSTLLPHLATGGLDTFRLALVAGTVVVLLLLLAGLLAGAILAGAFLVPVLYLVYLYEVRITRDAPAALVGMALGGGALLGLAVAVAARIMTPAAPFFDIGGSTGWILPAVIPVLVGELIKPIPVLVGARRIALQAPDGVVLGVASGVGFALGETLARYGSVLPGLESSARPADWIAPVLVLALLRPVLHGATTGVLVGLLARPAAMPSWGPVLAIGAVLLAAAFTIVDAALGASALDPVLRLLADVVVVALGVLALRTVLQHMLVREARAMNLTLGTCPGCDRRLLLGAFCPECGVATAASPRTPT